MRKRIKESPTDGPPLDVISYLAFCLRRGLAPYGRFDDPDSLDRSYAQQDRYMEQRRDYAQRYGIAESDLEMSEDSLPHDCWDPREI
jgi:hypothetical protein